MSHRPVDRLPLLPALLLVLASALPALAQTLLSGTVTRAGTGDPMGGAAVVIEELRRETRTETDGTYRFDQLAPGAYHVSVRAEGYSSRRAEVIVGAAATTLDLIVDLDLHFAEVVSVSPNPRPQFESFQPTSVLSNEELTRQLQETIGATLQSQPGVAMRSLGPGPARPVIRGLDGDRVLVLQDGQRLGDLSSQSGDHGVPVNPASAQRIEVVRGPATLLYGANAIGGLVNIVTDQIPTEKVTRPTGSVTLNGASNTTAAGAAADVHLGNGTFALHLGGGGQRADSYNTPAGEVANSQSRSGFMNIGGAWTGDRQYAGIELRLRRYEVRGAGARGRRRQSHAEATCLLGARRRSGPRRRAVVVSCHARRPPLHPLGTRGRRSRHAVPEQHGRRRGAPVAPSGPAPGRIDRRLVPQPRVQRRGHRGARAAGGPEDRGGLRLRRGDLAALQSAVRRPRRPHVVRAAGHAAGP